MKQIKIKINIQPKFNLGWRQNGEHTLSISMSMSLKTRGRWPASLDLLASQCTTLQSKLGGRSFHTVVVGCRVNLAFISIRRSRIPHSSLNIQSRLKVKKRQRMYASSLRSKSTTSSYHVWARNTQLTSTMLSKITATTLLKSCCGFWQGGDTACQTMFKDTHLVLPTSGA